MLQRLNLKIISLVFLLPTVVLAGPTNKFNKSNRTPSSISINGIFGSDITLPISGIDACSSSRILDVAITTSGINILEKSNFAYSATCKDIGNDRPADSSVPFVANGGGLQRACNEKQDVRCFGKSEQDKMGLCIVNPKSVATTEKYGDTSQTSFKRPRFSALYAFTVDSAGYQHELSWKMDEKGCQAVKGNQPGPSRSGPVTFNECAGQVKSFSDRPDLSDMESIHACLTIFPNIVDAYGRLPASGKDSK